jgi:hypothetical protein
MPSTGTYVDPFGNEQILPTTSGGTGTVTTVSVATANGVSGSVSNPTTTPAISLSLGAITPSSIAASGTITGSNLSGTNTGDQGTLVTSVGTPGLDTNVPSEKAVRTALGSTTVPSFLFYQVYS